MTLDDVAEELGISKSQVYALVRDRMLPSIKIGGRGQYRVERARLEAWIDQQHAATDQWLAEHPFNPGEADGLLGDGSEPLRKPSRRRKPKQPPPEAGWPGNEPDG